MKRFTRHSDEWPEILASDKESGGRLADLVQQLQQADEQAEAPADLIATLAGQAAAANASHPEGSGSPQPLTDGWRRRAMIKTFLSTLLGKLVLGGATVALATGGMAATGTLPDGAQRVAARAAAQIGLQLPSPDDSAPIRDRERTRTETGSTEASGTQTQNRSRLESGPADGSGTQTQTQTRSKVASGPADGSGMQKQTSTQSQTQTQMKTQTQTSTQTQTKTQTQTQSSGSSTGPGSDSNSTGSGGR